jgi:hypothetical protein
LGFPSVRRDIIISTLHQSNKKLSWKPNSPPPPTRLPSTFPSKLPWPCQQQILSPRGKHQEMFRKITAAVRCEQLANVREQPILRADTAKTRKGMIIPVNISSLRLSQARIDQSTGFLSKSKSLVHLLTRGQEVVNRQKVVADLVLDRFETRLALSDLIG